MDSIPTSGSPARYLRHAPKNISRTWSRDGSNIPGLTFEFALVADDALRAAGLAREADIAAVQDQPVVRIHQVLGRRELEQLLFHFQRVLARREPGAVGDAENVCVDCHGGRSEEHTSELQSLRHLVCRL